MTSHPVARPENTVKQNRGGSVYQPTWITRTSSPVLRALRPAAQALYLELAAQPGFSRQGWRGSIRDLSRKTGRHRSTITRAIHELEGAGLLKVDQLRWRWSRFRLAESVPPVVRKVYHPIKRKLERESALQSTLSISGSLKPTKKERESTRAAGPCSLSTPNVNEKRCGVPAWVTEWVASLPAADAPAPFQHLTEQEEKESRKALLSQARRMERTFSAEELAAEDAAAEKAWREAREARRKKEQEEC